MRRWDVGESLRSGGKRSSVVHLARPCWPCLSSPQARVRAGGLGHCWWEGERPPRGRAVTGPLGRGPQQSGQWGMMDISIRLFV